MKKQLPLVLLTVLFVPVFFDSAFAQSDYSKEPSDTFKQILQKAVGFADHNTWDSAVLYTKNVIALSEKEFGEISEHSADAYYLMGEVYRVKEDYGAACLYFKKSVDIFIKIEPRIYDRIIYSYALSRTGYMCNELGAKEEARFYFLKAIELNKQLNRTADNVQIYIQFAILDMAEGKYAKADSLFMVMKETLDTLPKNGFVYYLQGAVYGNAGSIYSQTGNLKKAIECTRKAQELEKIAKAEGYTENDLITVSLNLAQLYALANQTDSAWKVYQEAEDSLPYKWGMQYANLLKVKALINEKQNKFKEAIDINLQYKKIVDFLPVKPVGYYEAGVNLGILFTNTKQYSRADSLFRQQITHLRQSGLQYSYIMQQSVAGLCANLINLKKYDEAADTLLILCGLSLKAMIKNFSGMSELDKLKYEGGLDEVFNLLYICMYNSKTIKKDIVKQVYKLDVQRKGLILSNQSGVIESARNSKDAAVRNLYSRLLANRRILSNQYLLPRSQRRYDADSLEEINELLEKKISGKIGNISSGNNNLMALKQSFKKKKRWANIEFVRFGYKLFNKPTGNFFYAAFVTTSKSTMPVFVKLCNEKQLLALLTDKKGNSINDNQLTKKLYAPSNEAGRLYSLIWKPIGRYLTGVKNINYSTAGLLNNIALYAVYDGKDLLVNKFTLRRFFSLTSVSKNEEVVSRPKAISIWGNMNYDKAVYTNTTQAGSNNYDSSFSIVPTNIRTASSKSFSNEPLRPFSTNEILHLKNIFAGHKMKISSYQKCDASEEKFKEQTFNINSVLHISTHGFYIPHDNKKIKATLPASFISGAENPLFRCGLAFSGVNFYWSKGVSRKNHDDGILTGYEVSQMDLHNVQLVTLSACETGLGDVTDNEGNFGLQRAFKLAGAHNLLVSLWQVPAKHTSQLLSLFYTYWLQGKPLNVALRKAQLVIRKKYPPYFWAGFTLIE